MDSYRYLVGFKHCVLLFFLTNWGDLGYLEVCVCVCYLRCMFVL